MRCKYRQGSKECDLPALKDSKDGYCILHERSDNKNIEEFRKAIEEKLSKGDFDFSGCYFPPDFSFKGVIFEGDVDFTLAEFKRADFSGAEFKGKAKFSLTKFYGVPGLYPAANFRGAKFHDEVRFGGAKFYGDCWFDEAKIKKIVFDNTDIQGRLEFFVNELNSAELKQTSASHIWIGKNASTTSRESERLHVKYLHLELVTVSDQALFKNLDVETVIFLGLTAGCCQFKNVRFKRVELDVSSCRTSERFPGYFFMDNVELGSDCNEDEVRIDIHSDSSLRFTNVKFYTKTKLLLRCRDKAHLRDVEFYRDVDFHVSEFHGETYIDAKFHGKIDLRGAKFLGKIRISGNFENVLLAGCDVEHVDLTYVRWRQDYKILDEIELEKAVKSGKIKEIESKWKEVETVYRKLKLSYKNHGDYDTAGKFHYREWECKRKRAGKYSTKTVKGKLLNLIATNFSWINLYRVTFGYGEEPLRVIFASLFVILLWALIYMFCGIVVIPEYRIIDYKISIASSTPIEEILSDFWYCFYASALTFTSLGFGEFYPYSSVSKAFAVIEAFLGVFLISLFIVVFTRKMLR